jgi:hypothetical protein
MEGVAPSLIVWSRLPSAAIRTISLTGPEDDLKKADAEELTLAPRGIERQD